MKRTVLQFAGLWLGVSGAFCYAQGNFPTFGNTYRVAYANQDPMPAPPAVEDGAMDDAALPAPESDAAMSVEPGMPMSAGPIGYGGGAYGYAGPAYGAGYGGEACCEPTDPCAAGLWDGYWSARHHWCQKGHGCGHHGLLPQLNWTGGCCAHRACFGAGVGGDCCGAGHGGHGLFGGHGHGLGGLGLGRHGHAAGCGCAEEVVEGDCGCEPCGHGCGHRCFLPQLNWVGGCCAHRACFGGGVGVGLGHGGHGFLGNGLHGHGHHGVGVMDTGCDSCGD